MPTIKRCIVANCDWVHELFPPKLTGDPLKDRIITTGTLERQERELREHLGQHDLVEWAQTVMMWRSRSEAAHTKLLALEKELAKERLCPSSNPACAKTFRQ